MADVIQEISNLLWVIVPLMAVQLTLTGIALWQWNKKKEFLGQNKLIWLLIILIINIFGAIIFLIFSQRIEPFVSPKKGEEDDWEV